MNTSTYLAASLLTLALALLTGCRPSNSGSPQGGSTVGTLPPEVTAFAARKEAQAKALATQFNVEVASDVWAYFAAAKQGNWREVSRLWEKLRNRAGQYDGSKSDPTVASVVWQPVIETHMACEQFALGEPKYAAAFARDIIDSLPPGSIYFGGTDAGRGLVTALCASHESGDPFFILTQNGLTDNRYLDYLRAMYGQKLYIPTGEDSQQAFKTYLEDAQRRLQEHKLKPGEEVKMVNNRVQVSGHMSVIAVRALLAKVMFDRNPEREFFVEESFPLDWMYPHLEPHGLILKIYRQPLATLGPEVVDKDRAYWKERVGQMVGGWLKPETPVSEVCDFAERVFARRDLSGFTGDPKYVANTKACAMYSDLRGAIGGVYNWRMTQATEPAEKQRMQEAADYAFQQAFALCPYSPLAVFRYVQLLVNDGRTADALRVAQTILKIDPANGQLQGLVQSLEQMKKR